MAKLLVYYAHPGQKFRRANAIMACAAQKVEDITFVNLMPMTLPILKEA